jgi:hypothetical protein
VPRASIRGESSCCDRDGTFFLACNDAPEQWPTHLTFSDPERGTARVAVPPREEALRVVDLGDVALQRGATIRGRLVLGDGSALGGFQVRLQEFDGSVGTDVREIQRWLMRQQRSHEQVDDRDGRAFVRGAQANSLADGSFQFAGLDPAGSYLLDLWTVRSVAVVARPGSDPVDIRVDQQLLWIDVVDEHGDALPGAAVHLDGYDPAGTRPSFRERPGFPSTGQVAGNWLPCGDEGGRRILLTPFGFVWCLHTTDEHSEPVAVRHESLPGLHRATCRIVMRPQTRFGKLRVCAVDELGGALPFGATLKALDRDLQKNHHRAILPLEGFTWLLPAGRWQVEAVLGKEVLTIMDGPHGFARGNQQHVVVVESGRTTELRLVGKPAGLVSFDLHATPPLGDTWRSLRVESTGHEVVVVPTEGEHIRRGTPSTRFLTKEALPPGKHGFVLQVDGYQPATCTADVVADQLTTVRVELFAR